MGDELLATDDAIREKTRDLVYNPNCEVPRFEIGMKFSNHIEFKEALAKYSAHKGFAPRYLKNHCTWYLSASHQRDGSFRVVALQGHHI